MSFERISTNRRSSASASCAAATSAGRRWRRPCSARSSEARAWSTLSPSSPPAPATGTSASPATSARWPPCTTRGYNGAGHRARQFDPRLAARARPRRRVRPQPRPHPARLGQRRVRSMPRCNCLLAFDGTQPPGAEVPDPYYSDAATFDQVLAMIEQACVALFRQVMPRNSTGSTMSAMPPQPISPLDGRYHAAVAALGDHLSEAGLNRARVRVEVEWLPVPHRPRVVRRPVAGREQQRSAPRARRRLSGRPRSTRSRSTRRRPGTT